MFPVFVVTGSKMPSVRDVIVVVTTVLISVGVRSALAAGITDEPLDNVESVVTNDAVSGETPPQR